MTDVPAVICTYCQNNQPIIEQLQNPPANVLDDLSCLIGKHCAEFSMNLATGTHEVIMLLNGLQKNRRPWKCSRLLDYNDICASRASIVEKALREMIDEANQFLEQPCIEPIPNPGPDMDYAKATKERKA